MPRQPLEPEAIPAPPHGGAGPGFSHTVWLITAFWRSKASLSCWAFSLILVAMQFTTVYISILRNTWEKNLFDSIQQKNASALSGLMVTFGVIIVLSVLGSIAQIFLYGYVAVRWRAWLNDNYLQRWLAHNRYFNIERRGTLDNPDQRIADDLKAFSAQVLHIVMNFILAASSVSTFIVILWGLSSAIHLQLGEIAIDIPGDLVWYGILYALGGSWIIVFLGRPLIRRTMQQQSYEADYRSLLINVRRNAEQIAFFRAAGWEGRRLGQAFVKVYDNFFSLMRAQMTLASGQSLYSVFHDLLPIVLILPKYYAGGMTLGVMMQVRMAFEQLNNSLTWFVQVYPTIAEMTAVANRIRGLDEAMQISAPTGIRIETGSAPEFSASQLDLTLPNGEPLVSLADWTIRRGERWAIRGPSGAGKSTLLRALAGLWPFGVGTIRMPDGVTTMFVPQKLYLPAGTLRETLSFPDSTDRFDIETCRAALLSCRLPKLADRLEEIGSWQDELSPGEQQRLGFARILLRRPDVLFIDEGTSSLDRDNASAMYDAVLAELPDLTLISVIHADFLNSRHQFVLSVARGVAQPGARQVAIDDASRKDSDAPTEV